MKIEDVQSIKVGTTPVTKVYKGSTLVWGSFDQIITIINTITGGSDSTYTAAVSSLLVFQGGSSGTNRLTMLNQLAALAGGTGSHSTVVDALNDIIHQLGDVGSYTTELTAWTRIGQLLTIPTEYRAILNSLTGTKPAMKLQRAHINFIVYLKGTNPYSTNVWAKFSYFMPMFAGMPTAADALRWWNTPSRSGSLSTTAPTYTLGQGFTGNGTSAYINTTFNPSTDGGTLYTQNDCSTGWWFMNRRTTINTGGSGLIISSPGTAIFPLYASNTAYFRIQSDYNAFTNTATDYLFTVVRKSSTLVNLYRDRAILGTDISKASTALQNATFWNLAVNNGSNTAVANSYQTDTIGLSFAGAQLTSTDIAVLCDACDMLMSDMQTMSIIFQDACDGSTIDTNKWTTANLDPSYVTIKQQDALIVDSTTAGGGSDYWRNYIRTTPANTIINSGVWRFSAQFIAAHNQNSYSIIALKDINTYYPSGNTIQFLADLPSASKFNVTTGITNAYSVSAFEDFAILKIVVTPTHKISAYKWFNDAWVQIGTSQTYNLGTLQLCMGSRGVSNCTISMRDVFITNKDYLTLTP